MSETEVTEKQRSEIFEAEFRKKVRSKFSIDELLEVAEGGLHCELIKTHVNKSCWVESHPYADWSGRLAWWKAIAQAGGMIKDQVEAQTGEGSLMDLLLEGRRRVAEDHE